MALPTNDTAAVVETHALYKRFGERTAVDGLELRVPRGICFGLLGPNGAGKTTTLRMVYGVTRPTSGSIRVFGLEMPKRSREVRQRLGVTLQESVLIDPLTPEENLRVFGRYHLIKEPELTKRMEELIELLQLGSHRDVAVRTLSGGFRRRLAIALSLVNRPELLVLDEPTTGLDPAVRMALWSLVRELRARGTTVLLTTHYMDEAERLCERVGIMSGGKLVLEGSPRDLIERTLARETVELECSPAQEAALLDGCAAPRHRMRVGSRLVLHLDDAASFVKHVSGRADTRECELVVRPTTLEDVYLVLTGTSLEAGR